jgi:DHA1 family tetracycline resistance protein-like MFS transporter
VTHQGELQGVVASLVGLASVFGPLVFGWIYALSQPDWLGLVWIVGVAIYALILPVVLALPKKTAAD